MLYSLGRLLQFAGLIIIPVALAGNALERLDLKEMLSLAGVGMMVFFIGYMIQQWGKS